MKIIFDLDGTLIFSQNRLHQLFCDLSGHSELSFLKYWEWKHQGESNQSILKEYFNYSDVDIATFTTRWMREIESEYYLSIDSVIDGVSPFLEISSQKNELFICTARQSELQLERQLKNLSLFNFFKKIYVTKQKMSKEELILGSGMKLCEEDWFVGDTGHDINAGKKLGMRTCAVLSGFMSKSSLEKYKPDVILSDVTLLRDTLC